METPNMKSRVAALLGALLLTVWAATTALAVAPHGTVTVPVDGCKFSVLIDLDQAYDIVTWKVKEYNAVNWKDGKTLIKDSSATDPDGKITGGPYTLPEGHYNVAVDNEAVVDSSSIVVDFFLSCPTGSEAPIGSEAPSGSELPSGSEQPSGSEAPSGSELPAAGSPPPSGEVEGITGTPRPGNVTPPPTDTNAQGAAANSGGWQVVLMVILAVSMAAFGLLPDRVLAAARTTVRRRRR
jgi:hypothetical protein